MRIIVLCTFLLLFLPLCAVNVGGWILEDTVWTLENSPYVVQSFLYIGEDATLSIEPGVEVLVMGGNISGNWDDFRWSGTVDNPVEPIAKRIIVYGKISAFGTALAPVVFDNYEADPMYNWSGIEFVAGAPRSEFEYCNFKRTFLAYPFQSSSARWGALSIRNGLIHVRKCEFNMNWVAITTYPPGILEDTVIYGCKFYAENLPYYTFPPSFINVTSEIQPEPLLTVARCEFSGVGKDLHCYYVKTFMIFNKYTDYYDTEARVQDTPLVTMTTSFYGNESVNSRIKLVCYNNVESDSVFFRRNSIIYDNPTVFFASLILSSPYSAFFSDNYVRGNVQMKFNSANADIHNNVFESNIIGDVPFKFGSGSQSSYPDKPRVFNNLFSKLNPDSTGIIGAFYFNGLSPLLVNNTVIRYPGVTYDCSNGSNPKYYNNIFDGYSYSTFAGVTGSPPTLFHNCLEIPFPYEPYPYDGGGNIVANPIYADSLGGDFSQQDGSPCIDSGLNIPELPDFDIRYHKRIAAGTPGGPLTVDMGAYEYNSVYIGGIRGYVYDANTMVSLDCARIDIDGYYPEFSDTRGSFPFPAGAGTFTLRISRWDYEDLIIPNVVVTEGQDTHVSIALSSTTVSNDDAAIPPALNKLALANYPNPFKNETRIGFVLPESAHIDLAVYNIKGQKIKTIANHSAAKGYNSLIWDGKDSQGRKVGSGIYFLRLDSGNLHSVQRMMLIK